MQLSDSEPFFPSSRPVFAACRAVPHATLAASLALFAAGAGAAELELPWAAAGLTEREAAAHLLDRLAFGARPGDVDRLLEVGLAPWVERQLAGTAPEGDLATRLEPYDAVRMSAEELAATFPLPGAVLRRAGRAGGPADAEKAGGTAAGEGMGTAGAGAETGGTEGGEGDERRRRREAYRTMREQGYRPQRELVGQLQAQKVVRAVHGENQLHEVLADFWFNHFNVATTDNQARGYVLAYERDAIRPRVAGSFRDLLGATARHPAMLHYLDNAQSRAEDGRRVAPRGLNENYARELLELHTLGVDGGYAQQDVVEVARAFTGWSVLPPRELQTEGAGRDLGLLERFGSRAGFVTDPGGFFFNPAWHDAEQKTVLGTKLAAGRGIADGEQVLDLVAAHPATARHIARKLAVRFVADEPPEHLVDRLAAVFGRTGGDIAAVLRVLVSAPEFWASRGEKVKSPFELAVSAVRALDGGVDDPAALAQWIARMGQPLFAYQAPTGYPDRADFWVNTGSLLNRMSFGLQLAAGRVRGVAFDLDALLGGHEPESVDDALRRYAAVLLPERENRGGSDGDSVLERLAAVAREPALAERVEERAAAEPPASGAPAGSVSAQAQVVGVLLGSPGFQQR